MAWSLAKAGKPLIGANIYLAGDVPLGAGLSSSAAVEVAVAFALLSESGHAVDRSELAKLCQKAENEFVGARVGIITLQHKFVKLPADLQVNPPQIVFNSGYILNGAMLSPSVTF